jgi:hypothetical protein
LPSDFPSPTGRGCQCGYAAWSTTGSVVGGVASTHSWPGQREVGGQENVVLSPQSVAGVKASCTSNAPSPMIPAPVIDPPGSPPRMPQEQWRRLEDDTRRQVIMQDIPLIFLFHADVSRLDPSDPFYSAICDPLIGEVQYCPRTIYGHSCYMRIGRTIPTWDTNTVKGNVVVLEEGVTLPEGLKVDIISVDEPRPGSPAALLEVWGSDVPDDVWGAVEKAVADLDRTDKERTRQPFHA